MHLLKKTLLAIGFVTLSASSFASVEADVMTKLKGNFPGIDFTTVSKTPVNGIYEVVVNKKDVIYVEDTGTYFFPTMIQMATGKNFGEDKKAELNKVDFKGLPFKDAIKTVKGDGSRKLAIFSDPDCPYCRRLESSLKTVDNVTIYTFEYPLTGLHPNAKEKSISIWCASDKSKAWTDALLDGVTPAKKECSNPIERNIALANKMGIQGTPAIIFENGILAPGALDATQIEMYLSKK